MGHIGQRAHQTRFPVLSIAAPVCIALLMSRDMFRTGKLAAVSAVYKFALQHRAYIRPGSVYIGRSADVYKIRTRMAVMFESAAAVTVAAIRRLIEPAAVALAVVLTETGHKYFAADVLLDTDDRSLARMLAAILAV